MYSKFSTLVAFFSMGLFLVNGRRSLWEVPETNNVSETGLLPDDMWVNPENYPRPKSTLISANLWEGGKVPYKIDNKFFDFDKNLIRESMNEISKVSCIEFIEQTDEEDYIHIKNLYNCASHIGRTGNEQPIALSVKMCMKKGVIIHEIMHALGFVHEHCRSDRNDYIVIDENNIEDLQKHNFVKYETGLLNYWSEEYDFDSIMHYDAYAYAKDKSQPVITSLIPGGNLDIREVLSAADIRKLNKLYNC